MQAKYYIAFELSVGERGVYNPELNLNSESTDGSSLIILWLLFI
jgi:hypothetical protein